MKKTFTTLFFAFLVLVSYAEIRKGCLASFSIMKQNASNVYTTKSYVQDRLTTIFDAIENAGFNKHVNGSATWIDLIGERHINNPLMFNDNYCILLNKDFRTDY